MNCTFTVRVMVSPTTSLSMCARTDMVPSFLDILNSPSTDDAVKQYGYIYLFYFFNIFHF